MTLRTYNEFTVRRALKRRCFEWVARQQFASEHGLSAAYVADVILGRMSPNNKLLRALGFSKITRYVRTKRRQ